MADTLHMSLANFRDTMLMAIARLEFELRDAMDSRKGEDCRPIHVEHRENENYRVSELSNVVHTLSENLNIVMEKMYSLEQRISSPKEATELLNIEPPRESRNVVISSSVKSTPALSAAVASLHPPSMNLSEKDEDEVEESEDEVEEESEEEIEGEVEESVEEQVEEQEVAGEVVEEEEEQEEEEEESEGEVVEEEEEEGVEVEEFEYKGITYQRDADNNVYYDGNHIGTWTECQVKKKDGTVKMEWRIVKLAE